MSVLPLRFVNLILLPNRLNLQKLISVLSRLIPGIHFIRNHPKEVMPRSWQLLWKGQEMQKMKSESSLLLLLKQVKRLHQLRKKPAQLSIWEEVQILPLWKQLMSKSSKSSMLLISRNQMLVQRRIRKSVQLLFLVLTKLSRFKIEITMINAWNQISSQLSCTKQNGVDCANRWALHLSSWSGSMVKKFNSSRLILMLVKKSAWKRTSTLYQVSKFTIKESQLLRLLEGKLNKLTLN